MSKKLYIAGILILAATLTGCSSTQSTSNYTPGTIDDPIKLMEVKREYYKQRDEMKRREEEARIKAEQEAKIAEQKRAEEEAKAKLEAERKAEEERIKNMTPEEKLKYKMDNAMARIQEMNEIVDKARAEEIANTQSLNQLDNLLQQNN